jgi:hypothetical protein
MEKQNSQTPIRIELTEEQQKQVREATGKELSAFEFTTEQLEDRIAPKRLGFGTRN